jgi:hypothetical protein
MMVDKRFRQSTFTKIALFGPALRTLQVPFSREADVAERVRCVTKRYIAVNRLTLFPNGPRCGRAGGNEMLTASSIHMQNAISY